MKAIFDAIDFDEMRHKYFMSEQSVTGETKEECLEKIRYHGYQIDRQKGIRFVEEK